jgi:hypothetical protein
MNEEMIWKEEVVTYLEYCQNICLEGVTNGTKTFRLNISCLSRGSKREPSKYKSRALLLYNVMSRKLGLSR